MSDQSKGSPAKWIREPIDSAPAEVKIIIEKVLELEKNNIYKDRPRVVEDIVEIIKDAVK